MQRYLLSSGATVPKLNGSRLRPDIAWLVRFWAGFVGVLLTGALVLQALGPPAHRTAAPTQVKPMAPGAQVAEAVPPRSVPSPRAEPEAQAATALPSPAPERSAQTTAATAASSTAAAPAEPPASLPSWLDRRAAAIPEPAPTQPPETATDHAQPGPPLPESDISRAAPGSKAAAPAEPPAPAPSVPDRTAAALPQPPPEQSPQAVADHAQPSPPLPEQNISRAAPSSPAAGQAEPHAPSPSSPEAAQATALSSAPQQPPQQQQQDTAKSATEPAHLTAVAPQPQRRAALASGSRQGSESAAPSAHPVAARAPLGEHRQPNRQYYAAASAPRPPTVHDMLQSAEIALAGNNASAARGLLESAETAIVFQPVGSRSESTSVAATQISRALRELNYGDRALAAQYVGQAAAAVGSAP